MFLIIFDILLDNSSNNSLSVKYKSCSETKSSKSILSELIQELYNQLINSFWIKAEIFSQNHNIEML